MTDEDERTEEHAEGREQERRWGQKQKAEMGGRRKHDTLSMLTK